LKSTIISNFKSYFSNPLFFYHYLGPAIFIAICANILVGVLDGLGLSIFMPLLQMSGGEKSVTPSSIGKLGIILEWASDFNFELNIQNLLIIMSLFFIFKGIVKFYNSYFLLTLQLNFVSKLRIKLLRTFTNISFRYYSKADIGRIQNTMNGEITRVTKASRAYFSALEQLILVIVYLVFAFSINIQFSIWVTVGGIISNLIFTFLNSRTKSISLEITKLTNQFQGLLVQYTGSYKYLKATGLINQYENRLEKVINENEDANKKIGIIACFMQAVREPVMIVIVSAIILIQVNVQGQPIAPILLSLLFFYRSLSSLLAVQAEWNNFFSCFRFFKKHDRVRKGIR
jgi:subfamily B ATP-binding cassette protein MsbA